MTKPAKWAALSTNRPLPPKHPIIVPQATAKLVFAYARADIKPAFDNHRVNQMYSVRLRMLYSF